MGIYTLAYDKINGNILAGCEGEDNGFLNTIEKDADAISSVTDRNANNIGIMVSEIKPGFFSTDYMVKDDKIIPRCKIELTTNASDRENPNGVPEIAGDGKSTCEITATIMKPGGTVDKKASVEVRFYTGRGRLSARNGIVKSEKGTAKVTLTSIPETVPPFEIRGEAEGCRPGSCKIEFF